MAIKQRLKNIENRIGVAPCECQSERIEVITLQPDQPEPPAKVCPKCGKTKLMIVVKYIERETWGSL